MNNPKVSIITVCFNAQDTLSDTILSVIRQKYSNLEYIIIDGGSTDRTVDIIKQYARDISYWVSEKDKGIYDAMNKGIKAAAGEIIGIINADDFYADELVIGEVVAAIDRNNVDACYGDAVYIDRDKKDKVVRYWPGKEFCRVKFRRGWMPQHATFFAKKCVYDKYGDFNTSFPIAADYELILRFLYKHNVSVAYLPKILVKVRVGGASKPGVGSTIKAMKDNYRAWKINGLAPNPFTFILKPLSKLLQYIFKN